MTLTASLYPELSLPRAIIRTRLASSAEVIATQDHSPYLVVPPLEAAKAGFYDGLVSLQGQHGTYWTGAAWQSYDSSAIWNFTEYEVLPMILGGLGSSANGSSARAGY